MKKSFAGLLCLLLCVCYGCTGSNNAPKKAAAKKTVTLEARDESTGEESRLHKFDENGREYETHIHFRNKSVGVAQKDPGSGVVLEYELTHPNSKKILEHSKFSPDGKRLVWQETHDIDGKLQTRKQELPNKDCQENVYSENAEQQLTIHPNGDGELKQWIKLPDQTERHLWLDLSWKSDGSFHSKFYAGQKIGKDEQLLSTHDKEKDGPLIESYYAAGGQVFLRSYWRPLTPEELKEPAMSYAGEWLLQKVEELPYGYDKEKRIFLFDGTPFQTSADKVEIIAEDGNSKTVIYKKAGAKEKAADKVEVYDKDGKLVDKPEPTPNYDGKLHPKDPRSVQPPMAITADWIKERNNGFKPEALISNLSNGK